MNKVIVIGGGASGMLAAIIAAREGADVTLIEKNEKLGKKIYITGKGRCNLTNDCDRDTFFANVTENPKFMYSAYAAFDKDALLSLLSEGGLKTKTERGGRVFPVSDHASDVTGALKRLLDRARVEILLNTEVAEMLMQDLTIKGVRLTNGNTLYCDRVILCTGGLSYPSTGSDGFGLKAAKALGLKVTDTAPSLVPFNAKESYVKELQGLAPRNVSVKVLNRKNKVIYEEFGEMLFTHFGVSGPLMLSASSVCNKAIREEELKLLIDFKPAIDEATLDKRLLRIFDENKNKALKNSINSLMPASMIPVVIELAGIDPEKKVNEISKGERGAIVSVLKEFPVTLTSLRGYNEAIITRGGISVKEVNPKTMETKQIKGLFVAGEVLDVDALTGGFNLQIAWSTGYLAGLNAAQ